MKKTHAGLLFAVMATGLIFSGCQKPAEVPVEDEAVTGTITIEPAPETATVNGSITIEMPDEKEVNGAISIVPANGEMTIEVVEDVVTLGN